MAWKLYTSQSQGSVKWEFIYHWLPQLNGCCGNMYQFHSHINQDITISGDDVVSHSKTWYTKFKLKHGSPIFCHKKRANWETKLTWNYKYGCLYGTIYKTSRSREIEIIDPCAEPWFNNTSVSAHEEYFFYSKIPSFE